jgi:hypothetical protein
MLICGNKISFSTKHPHDARKIFRASYPWFCDVNSPLLVLMLLRLLLMATSDCDKEAPWMPSSCLMFCLSIFSSDKVLAFEAKGKWLMKGSHLLQRAVLMVKTCIHQRSASVRTYMLTFLNVITRFVSPVTTPYLFIGIP